MNIDNECIFKSPLRIRNAFNSGKISLKARIVNANTNISTPRSIPVYINASWYASLESQLDTSEFDFTSNQYNMEIIPND